MTDLVERVAHILCDRSQTRIVARVTIAECFKWRPIETVPRDGTIVLACWPQQGNLIMIIWYSSVQGFWVRTGREPVIPMQATHWMPLPDPPKETAS